MKDELQNKLLEILTQIQAATGKASDFAIEQLPDIAQQYLVYGRISNSVLFGVIFVFLLAALFITLRYGFFSNDPDEVYGWSDSRVIAAIAGSVSSIVFLVVLLTQLSNLIMVWVAPKVWLIKQFSLLVK